MLNCHADGSAATEAAAVIWYVCASDMGIRIPVRASHATCCEALRLVTHSKVRKNGSYHHPSKAIP